MSKPKLEFTWDQNLRDIPRDPLILRQSVNDLQASLINKQDPESKIKILGQLGVQLRCLGDLRTAEDSLLEALELIYKYKLGISEEIQQKIRLAHVLQWKLSFEQSNVLFSEVIEVCRANPEAEVYLDFALQHAGKNLFDQRRYEEALQFFEEALAIRIKKQSPSDQLESTTYSIKRTKQVLGLDDQ